MKSLEQLARERLGASEDQAIERDDAYMRESHFVGGATAIRDLGRGRDIHVFEPGIDLDQLEREVWLRGEPLGRLVGERIQVGRPAVPLHGVEIKAELKDGRWSYHLDPRASRARE